MEVLTAYQDLASGPRVAGFCELCELSSRPEARPGAHALSAKIIYTTLYVVLQTLQLRSTGPKEITPSSVPLLPCMQCDAYCNGLRSILQLSDDDSTSITELKERKRKEEKMANASRWFLSAQMATMDEKG